jgi:hypothetical protein
MSFDEMNKAQLRAACKAAGIPYGKLNNDGMRDALKALEAAAGQDTETVDADEDSDDEGSDEGQTNESEQPAPAAQSSDQTTPVGHRPKVPGAVVEAKSLKIEKNRPSANGVRKPSVGSICREIWDALDVKRRELDAVPEFEHVRELMVKNNWQRNTAFTQFQRWKQFNGVMPRTTDAE